MELKLIKICPSDCIGLSVDPIPLKEMMCLESSIGYSIASNFERLMDAPLSTSSFKGLWETDVLTSINGKYFFVGLVFMLYVLLVDLVELVGLVDSVDLISMVLVELVGLVRSMDSVDLVDLDSVGLVELVELEGSVDSVDLVGLTYGLCGFDPLWSL